MQETPDPIASYEPKLQTLLEQVRTEAHERGYECNEPADMTDEYYRWSVLIYPKGEDHENGVDVTVAAPESEAFEGEENGVNFSCDVVHYDGRILGGFTPYNYTSDVWVDRNDPEAVKARWELFQGHFDASALLDLVDAHYTGNDK